MPSSRNLSAMRPTWAAGTSPSNGQPKAVAIAPCTGVPARFAISHHLRKARERFLDRAVDVLAVVGLRRGDEHAKRVRAGLDGPRRPFGVRDQRDQLRAPRAVDPGQHLGGIRQLRHRARRDERGELHARHARLDQLVDQRDLGRGRDEVVLDLKTVARPDLGHGHLAGSRHGLSQRVSSASAAAVRRRSASGKWRCETRTASPETPS